MRELIEKLEGYSDMSEMSDKQYQKVSKRLAGYLTKHVKKLKNMRDYMWQEGYQKVGDELNDAISGMDGALKEFQK